MAKPIHKLNGGNCATLCNRCRKIIDIGFINELYCSKKCEMKTKLERIESVIKYYYDRGTNREKVNEIKRKLLKDEATVPPKK